MVRTEKTDHEGMKKGLIYSAEEILLHTTENRLNLVFLMILDKLDMYSILTSQQV